MEVGIHPPLTRQHREPRGVPAGQSPYRCLPVAQKWPELVFCPAIHGAPRRTPRGYQCRGGLEGKPGVYLRQLRGARLSVKRESGRLIHCSTQFCSVTRPPCSSFFTSQSSSCKLLYRLHKRYLDYSQDTSERSEQNRNLHIIRT